MNHNSKGRISRLTLTLLLTTGSLLAAQGTPELDKFDKVAASFDPINNSATIDPMYDAVTTKYHLFRVDPTSASLLKPFVTSKEIHHWNNKVATKDVGVDEKDIVSFVNNFAIANGLPEEAQTTISQVHHLRMRQIMFSQNGFMKQGVKIYHDPETDRFTTDTTKMSPLQAIHLTQVLIDQKIITPFYQVKPKDWENNLLKADPTPEQTGFAAPTAIGQSIQAGLKKAFVSMSDPDAISLLTKVLGSLQ